MKSNMSISKNNQAETHRNYNTSNFHQINASPLDIDNLENKDIIHAELKYLRKDFDKKSRGYSITGP